MLPYVRTELHPKLHLTQSIVLAAPYTFTYSINNNGTQAISTAASSSNTTIAVSTTTEGQYNYVITRVSDNNGCSQAVSNTSARVTVNKLPQATMVTTGTVACKNNNNEQPIITLTGSNGTKPIRIYIRNKQ